MILKIKNAKNGVYARMCNMCRMCGTARMKKNTDRISLKNKEKIE